MTEDGPLHLTRADIMSSSNFRRVDDYLLNYDHDFTVDISKKMQVPKKIKVAENDDELPNSNYVDHMIEYPENFMKVPERIILAGGDNHIAGKAPPRELQLEQAVIPPDPEFIRVQTPPRVITLSEHQFPTADDDKSPENSFNQIANSTHINNRISSSDHSLAVNEELKLMRNQIMKLSRKMMAIEIENQQRQNREIVFYSLGFTYLVLKTLAWLFRN